MKRCVHMMSTDDENSNPKRAREISMTAAAMEQACHMELELEDKVASSSDKDAMEQDVPLDQAAVGPQWASVEEETTVATTSKSKPAPALESYPMEHHLIGASHRTEPIWASCNSSIQSFLLDEAKRRKDACDQGFLREHGPYIGRLPSSECW